jgi:hypothetical protein
MDQDIELLRYELQVFEHKKWIDKIDEFSDNVKWFTTLFFDKYFPKNEADYQSLVPDYIKNLTKEELVIRFRELEKIPALQSLHGFNAMRIDPETDIKVMQREYVLHMIRLAALTFVDLWAGVTKNNRFR